MPERPADQALTNRAYWDRTSDEYQERHREFIGRAEPRWGVWHLHEQDDGDVVTYELPYGEWIRLFRANGFVVQDLIEPRPAPDAQSTYWDDEERDRALRWPSESIWKARKAG